MGAFSLPVNSGSSGQSFWQRNFVTRTFVLFCAIGIVNTAVDLGIFVSLQQGGLSIFLANIVSTSAALAVSYVLNRRFTFKSDNSSKKSGKKTLLPFLAVTLTGIWLLQPAIIYAVVHLLGTDMARHLLGSWFGSAADYATFQALAGKLIATPATIVWNYVLYKKFVFTDRRLTTS
jgi:putative flippase GtrA